MTESSQEHAGKGHNVLVSIFAALCSFGVYSCMFGFRKPITVAAFKGMIFLGVSYKVWVIVAQVAGYMLSKFYGIKFISSIEPSRRAGMMVLMILAAWGALLLFAITPAPYNIFFMLLNGFPLGLMWGLVFSYLEGRSTTEAMGAFLCTSFILSSGVTKSIGKWLLQDYHLSENWMPFLTGLIFIIPFILFVWLLNKIPPPSEYDKRMRTERKPMTQGERRDFVRQYWPGLALIVATYVLLTVMRDFRDNFANELWTELGYGNQASAFTKSEVPASILVLALVGLLVLVKSNIKAFMINHAVILLGYLVCILATVGFQRSAVSGPQWMTILGIGLYFAYVPFNSLFFERMIASYRIRGNVGFVMYIADSFGYVGTVTVLLFKEFSGIHLSWTSFYITMLLAFSGLSLLGTCLSIVYFLRKYRLIKGPVPS